MKTLLIAVLMVHNGHVAKWHSSHPIPARHDIQLQRVSVNGSALFQADTLRQASAFMYGEGVVVRFVTRPRKRFTIRATSLRHKTAKLRVTYWVVKH